MRLSLNKTKSKPRIAKTGWTKQYMVKLVVKKKQAPNVIFETNTVYLVST